MTKGSTKKKLNNAIKAKATISETLNEPIAKRAPEPPPTENLIHVIIADHSQSYRQMTRDQFEKGKVKTLGEINVTGLIMTPGHSYSVEHKGEIQSLLNKAILRIARQERRRT